jgi:hypothetical protein
MRGISSGPQKKEEKGDEQTPQWTDYIDEARNMLSKEEE